MAIHTPFAFIHINCFRKPKNSKRTNNVLVINQIERTLLRMYICTGISKKRSYQSNMALLKKFSHQLQNKSNVESEK